MQLINKDAWKPLRYHAKQAVLMHSSFRFLVVRAGRRSGKTECSKRRIVMALAKRMPWVDPNYAYCLPTRDQAKKVAWENLKKLVPENWLEKEPSETELTIRTVFGSTLYLIGMDKPHRIEGPGFDGVVLDERADMKPGILRSVLPALLDRNGWLVQTGVPKRFGIGAAEFNEIFNRGLRNQSPLSQVGNSAALISNEISNEISSELGSEQYISLTWPSRDILTPAQLAFAKRELPPLDYREQFEADEIKPQGQVYYSFDHEKNVDGFVVYNPSKPILVGSDFNVSPMGWALGQEYEFNGDKHLHIFDEVFLYDTNTQLALAELDRRYKHHNAGFVFYGDATSRQRKTAAGTTTTGAVASDYYHIVSHPRFKNSQIRYPASNPAVVNRQAAVNRMLADAEGNVRLKIAPKCTNLIRDFQTEGYDKSKNASDIGHIADGLGYLVWAKYPLRVGHGEYQDKPQTVGIFAG